MRNITSLIHEFLNTQEDEKLKIAVVGDVLLDQFYQVAVNRISPEFPIPVLASEVQEPTMTLPGGAANVAYQFAGFNVDCTLFGITDKNAASLLHDFGFKCDLITFGYQTPRKRRFFDKDLPLCRWDIESYDPEWAPLIKARKQLVEKFEKYVYGSDPDIIILSDYGKGLFYETMAQDLIELCSEYGVPTLVDPKLEPIDQWLNCTIFKPNAKEAEDFCRTINGYNEDILSEVRCEALVITQGADGVQTYLPKKPPLSYKSDKPVVGHPLGYSGAGDCFAAVYAMAYALNFDFQESAIIANHASSIFVQKKHTDPVTPWELHAHIDPIEAKIFNNAKWLGPHLDTLRGTKVFTNGCFDLLHQGHLRVLEFAKAQGDILIVGIDSDANVKRLKGADKPIKSLDERMRLIASMQHVDFVVPFDGDVYNLIRNLSPMEILVKGGDYHADKVIGGNLVDEVIICPLLEDFSTTKTIEKIKDAKPTKRDRPNHSPHP